MKKGLYASNVIFLAVTWIVLFILYLPAAKAGRVGDFGHWVANLRGHSFTDYINYTGCPSFYQFTQIVTWFFYQLIGTNAWGWHLIHLTLQAINGLLSFIFFKALFKQHKVPNGNIIAAGGSLLFCICPHINEVIVWKPSFHYLLGVLCTCSVLISVQGFLATFKAKYAWRAGIIFLLSSFSLEIFYLTPLFTGTLILSYYYTSAANKTYLKKAMLMLLLPQILLLAVHIVAVQAVYGHVGEQAVKPYSLLFSKPVKYIFHLVFMGRYFSDKMRHTVYDMCETAAVLWAFYLSVAAILAVIVFRFRGMSGMAKSMGLVFTWIMFSIAFISFLWFPDNMVVIFDRYTYLPDAFLFPLLTMLISSIPNRYIASLTWAGYAMVNTYYTAQLNASWKKSAEVVNSLLTTFPNDPAKTVLLLNVPETYKGIQMIGARDEEFKLMYNTLMATQITNKVYDVVAYNTLTPEDGAHVKVLNDTTIEVTLNQWGTWWWSYGVGAGSYENNDYKVNMVDAGHRYELTIKKSPEQYLLLYQVGGKWKITDWKKKGEEQN